MPMTAIKNTWMIASIAANIIINVILMFEFTDMSTNEKSVYWSPYIFFDIVLYTLVIFEIILQYTMWPYLKKTYTLDDNFR